MLVSHIAEASPMRPARLAIVMLAAGCLQASAQDPDASARPSLANPAAVLCIKHGATIEKEIAADGGQRGVCVFPDGTRIDEWAYFRNTHRSH